MSTATTPIAEAPAPTVQYAESQAFGIASLVTGISSIAFGFTFLVPIAAIWLGILGLQREPASRTMSIWGIVLGSIALLGTALAVVLGVALFVPFGLLALFAV